MARSPADPIKQLRKEFTGLQKRVETLESERPGRKAAPMLAAKREGVCALDPSIDSTQCEKASIYRYQSGCHGHACRAKQRAAYARRQANAAARRRGTPVKVRKKAVVKKAPLVKTPAKKAAPTKRLTSVKNTATAATASKKTIKRLAS